jgi:hypothetical protein
VDTSFPHLRFPKVTSWNLELNHARIIVVASMARITQGDQIFLRIIAERTPEANVVNLNIL